MSGPGVRYDEVTSRNHSAELWVMTILCIMFSTTALAARILSKRAFHCRYETDDYVALGSFALIIAQTALMLAALAHGLGNDADDVPARDFTPMNQLFRVSQATLFAALYAIKVSMIFLTSRVFTQSLKAYWIAFCVLGGASVIAVSAGCTSFECGNRDPTIRWIAVITVDILTEIAVILLPITSLFSYQIKTKFRIKLSMSFGSRILLIPFSSLTIWALSTIIRNNAESLKHPTTAIVLPSIFQQVELTLSFAISSMLPCLSHLFNSSDMETTHISRGNASHSARTRSDALSRKTEQESWRELSAGLSTMEDEYAPPTERESCWGHSDANNRPTGQWPPQTRQ